MTREETKQAIKIMQAWLDGAKIEVSSRPLFSSWVPVMSATWDWQHYNYRIQSKTKTVTLEAWVDVLGELQWGQDQIMAIAAIRYCLGRRTYIVRDCADWIIQMWPNFTESTQALIQKDIEEEFKRDDDARKEGSEYKPLGMDMDRREWERVRKLWSKKK